MTDMPSEWAIKQAAELITAMGPTTTREEIERAMLMLARALDAMRPLKEVPLEGLGYGGVVRSHHDGD
jgi:hypothetical protein